MLDVLDLLEDLAHSRPHEVALFGVRLAVAPADPLGFAGIEVVVQRDLMRPGMGKVFKQIQDVQRKAAPEPRPRPPKRRPGAKPA